MTLQFEKKARALVYLLFILIYGKFQRVKTKTLQICIQLKVKSPERIRIQTIWILLIPIVILNWKSGLVRLDKW